MNICVVGTGYVGLVAAACLAETGNTVIGVDIDREKIDGLKRAGIEKVVMLTGDNAPTAKVIAAASGVDEFHAELPPQGLVDHLASSAERNEPK